MRGGQHRPYQLPCPGTVLCGTGPKYAHKKYGEGAVAAIHETTQVNSLDPTGLPAALVCNVASGHPDAYDPTEVHGVNFGHSPSPHGPWVNAYAPVPPTFAHAGGYQVVSVSIADGGTDYGVGNGLAVVGGTANVTAATIYVDAVDGAGKITVAHLVSGGGYTSNPSSPNSPTGGAGSGASFNLTFGTAMVDLSTCRNGKFKNVQAKRSYHGRRGFLFLASQNLACGYPFYPFTPNVDRTKYLTITASFSIKNIDFDSRVGNYTEYWGACTMTVSPLSGNRSQSGSGGSRYVDVTTTPPSYYDVHDVVDSAMIFDMEGGGVPTWYLDFLAAIAGGSDGIASRSITNTLHAIHMDSALAGTSFDGSIELSNPNPDSDVYADALYLKSLWDLNDDIEYPWRADGNVNIAPLVTRNEPGPVGPTLIFDSAWVDPNAAIYDGSVLGAPLPAGYGYNADGSKQGIFDFRHEVDDLCFSDSPPYRYLDAFNYGCRAPDYLPQNCTQWTADMDAPYATAGKFLFFNGRTDSLSGWTMASSDVLWIQDWKQTEETWPSYNFARPAGADRFVFYETHPNGTDAVFPVLSGYSAGTGDTIILGYAPVQITDSNGNHPGSVADDPGQLPYGAPVDYIITVGGGGSLSAGELVVTTGDVWGGQSVGGFYHVTKTGDSQVLLGTKVFNIPTGWTCPSEDEDTAFGKLRFPYCPGILGRVAISAITNASPCHLTIDASPYLATNLTATPPSSEMVDLCARDMTVLASNVEVTRVGDTDFTVPNSGSTAYATIASAKFVVVHGSPAYYWDDTMPKGHVLALEFSFDYRAKAEAQRIKDLIIACGDTGSHPEFIVCDCSPLGSIPTVPFSMYSAFTQTQLCVPWTQCGPRVAPMANFPAEFPMDSQYGSRWQACVVSAIRDLLWQKPHHPPTITDPVTETDSTKYAWLEDDGSCAPNVTDETGATTIAYYAHAPMVEPFISLPGTDGWPGAGADGTEAAPTVPAGITVGFTSPVTNGDADTLYAPGPGGWTPWGLHDALCGCVGGSGRFSGTYAAFTFDC